jgi:hypothetical protein
LHFKQKLFQHDYATFYFRDWSFNPRQVRPGSLMQFEILGKQYHGYVHDISFEESSNKKITKVGFIGASYVMRQASRKIYVNMTADQIVTQIAKKYKFAHKTIPHPRIYDQVSQAGMTDWELMVKLAKQCGYSLRAENTELYFQPLMYDFEQLHEEAFSFQKIDAGFRPINMLYSFKALVSETSDHELGSKSAASVSGVDPITGKLVSHTVQDRGNPTRARSNQEFFDSHEINTVAPGYAIAVHEATGAKAKSQHPYTAMAEVLGLPKLRPGLPVYFKNVGHDNTGYWHILGVEHVILEKSLGKHVYTSHLFVGTDSLGETANLKFSKIPSDRPIRRIIPNVKNTVIKPTSAIKTLSFNIKPVNSVSLVDRINRENADTAFSTKSNWVSSHGDLNFPPPEELTPIAVLEKVRNNAILQ